MSRQRKEEEKPLQVMAKDSKGVWHRALSFATTANTACGLKGMSTTHIVPWREPGYDWHNVCPSCAELSNLE